MQWTIALAVTALVAGPAATARPAIAEPGSSPELTEIFLDGFESGGTCNWAASSPCALYIVTIPNGTGAGDHHFPPSISVDLGATIRFYNADVDRHTIHGYDPACGFPHEVDPGMGQGDSWDVTPTCLGDYAYYCHSHGTGAGTGMVHVH
jgi:plastocyanin